MEYAASKVSPANSKPPTLASAASSIHSTKQPNGHSPTPQPTGEDDDPRGQLVETLRIQLTDTHNQLDQLNSKLVQSYDRVSSLEETLDNTNESLNAAKTRIKELEAAKAEHEAALETGMLVEREHVAHELSRLMERATEEAAQRGVADAARSRIETELDDLSANLFASANTMVAEARIARAASERKVEETEGALKSAEDAIKSMQMQLQQIADARRDAELKVAELRARMGSGKWVEGDGELEITGPQRRLYSSHAIYREFVAFVSHLRNLRANAGVIPQLSTLTSLPLIARLIVEDCDPTLRLDLAPALNWLTRRAVHAAVLQGQLEIEPVYGLQEAECALCGSHPNGSLPSSTATSPTTATHALSPKTHTPTGSGTMVAWASSTSKYFKGAMAPPTTSSQTHTNQVAQSPLQRVIADPNAPPIYIFRIAGAQAGAGAAPFTLCAGGWCLARLRTTCELCAFLKRGVIEKVWSEPPQPLHQGPTSASIQNQQGVLGSVVNALSRDKDSIQTKDKESGDTTPTVPPRRRQLSQLGTSLWEKGLGAFGGSRTGSRSGTPGPEETKETPPPQPERRLPPPPAPVDTKLTIVPPPPPPRARPVPPVPSKPEEQETHEGEHEHQEPIHHAMVFDAAADEHGHHALSPTGDKRHSIPITLHQPLRPISSPRSPTDTLATLPESTTASEAHHPASEHPPEPSPSAPAPDTHLAPQREAEHEAPETPRPPPVTRPPRARPVAHDGIPHRPMSPNGVPLPDSRPGTPAMSARNVSPSRARTPSPTRFRATSPSIASPSRMRNGSIRRDVESIRASSPVPSSPIGNGPPKIPRRAPRRAAPVPPGTPSKTERKAEENEKAAAEVEKKSEETTVPKVEEVKSEAQEDKTTEDEKPKVEDRPVPRPPPRRAVPPPPAPPLPARAKPPQPVEHAEEVKEPEVEDAEEPRPIDTKSVADESISEQSAYTDGAPSAKESVPPVTTLVTSATTDSVSHIASIPHTTETNGTDSRRPTEIDGQFVGDHSWEERAYKEIVKLREDMFWARIGSTW
ncbi:Cell surface glycoprotein 1 [Rhizoctonia solani]|uniref:Cell surface glycoprotein 1 n=1 Tax=Rhizoctonia solani TaxID=456999 RepID=A0A0K6G6M3_9AGAM|nr:Cell surface glycoprotein 1 [Rhizoctonia solani]